VRQQLRQLDDAQRTGPRAAQLAAAREGPEGDGEAGQGSEGCAAAAGPAGQLQRAQHRLGSAGALRRPRQLALMLPEGALVALAPHCGIAEHGPPATAHIWRDAPALPSGLGWGSASALKDRSNVQQAARGAGHAPALRARRRAAEAPAEGAELAAAAEPTSKSPAAAAAAAVDCPVAGAAAAAAPIDSAPAAAAAAAGQSGGLGAAAQRAAAGLRRAFVPPKRQVQP
jgi:hypothetical protein